MGRGQRTDPLEAEAARHAEMAKKYLDEGDAELERDARHGPGQAGNQADQVDDKGEPGPRENGPPGSGYVTAHAVTGTSRHGQDVCGAGVFQAAVRFDRAAQAVGGGDEPRKVVGPLYG